jgi:hypothetical protein
MAQTRKFGLASRRTQAGKASKYIDPFQICPGDRFILCCRVSGREQKRNKNCEDQATNLRQIVSENGGSIVDVVSHVGTGWDSCWLIYAANLAKLHDATLLAESTDRFVRSPLYHSAKMKDEQARRSDLEGLRFDTAGVRLMTHLHPDSEPRHVRSYQRKRGQQQKGNKGGRRKKKRGKYFKSYKSNFALLKVKWMKIAGFSIREMAKHLERSSSTIQSWLRQVNRYK